MQFRVRLDEILPTKTAARQLPRELARLEQNQVDQLVLTTRNTPRAVIISIERYDELLAAEAELTAGEGGAAGDRTAPQLVDVSEQGLAA